MKWRPWLAACAGLSLLFSAACSGSDDQPGAPASGGSSAGAQGGSTQGGSTQGGSAQGGSSGSQAMGGAAGSVSAGGASGSNAGGSAHSGGSGNGDVCPPVGPYGNAVGDIASDVELYDCDGTAVSLHELCESDVSVVYTFAAWCPVCRSHMESGRPNQLLDDHPSGLTEWVVVTQLSDGSNANAELCSATRDQYSLKGRVLFDPNDALRSTLGVQVNSGALLLTRGQRIDLKLGYDFDAVEDRVDQLLP